MVLISEAYECNLHPENDDQDSSDLGGTPVHADLTVSDISTISTASTSECNVSRTAPPTQQPEVKHRQLQQIQVQSRKWINFGSA